MNFKNKLPKVIKVVSLCIILGGFGITGCDFFNQGHANYKKAMKEFDNENYEKAQEYFKVAIKKSPENALYYIAYGQALTAVGKYAKAEEILNEAVLDKNNQIVKENNKKAYRALGICFFRNKDYKKAVSFFDKALKIKELDNLNLDILMYKGDALYYMGDYKKAVSLYADIISKNEYKSSYYIRHVYACEKNGELEKALEDCKQIIKLEPKYYDAYIEAYLILATKGDMEQGSVYLDKLLSIEDSSEMVRFKKEIARFYKESDSSVEGFLQLAQEGNVKAYYYLGNIAFKAGKYAEASDYLEQYLHSDDSDYRAKTYSIYGDCFLNIDNEFALKQYQKGMTCNDASIIKELKMKEIVACEKMGKMKSALKKAEEYMKQYPDDKEIKKELEFIKTRL